MADIERGDWSGGVRGREVELGGLVGGDQKEGRRNMSGWDLKDLNLRRSKYNKFLTSRRKTEHFVRSLSWTYEPYGSKHGSLLLSTC